MTPRRAAARPRRPWFAQRSWPRGRPWFAARSGRRARPWFAARSRGGGRPWFARRRGDRGNAALDLVILPPAIVLLIGIVVAAGDHLVAGVTGPGQ